MSDDEILSRIDAALALHQRAESGSAVRAALGHYLDRLAGELAPAASADDLSWRRRVGEPEFGVVSECARSLVAATEGVRLPALAPAPEQPAFKVGDRVRVVRKAGGDWIEALDETIGEEGTVTDVNPNAYAGHTILVEGMPSDRDRGGWRYDPASLELVTESSPPAAEVLPRVVDWKDLKPGDLAWDVYSEDEPLLINGPRRAGWRKFNGEQCGPPLFRHNTRPTSRMMRWDTASCCASAARAILVARSVKRNAKRVAAAWKANEAACRALAEREGLLLAE